MLGRKADMRLEADNRAKDEVIEDLRQRLFRAQQDVAAMERSRRVITEAYQEQVNGLERDKAYLDGQLSEARLNAEHFAGKYHQVIGQHDWHRGGSCFAHGQHYDLYECLSCRSDAGTNIRLLLPEGMAP